MEALEMENLRVHAAHELCYKVAIFRQMDTYLEQTLLNKFKSIMEPFLYYKQYESVHLFVRLHNPQWQIVSN